MAAKRVPPHGLWPGVPPCKEAHMGDGVADGKRGGMHSEGKRYRDDTNFGILDGSCQNQSTHTISLQF